MRKGLKVYVGAGLIALTALAPGAAIANGATHYHAHGHSHQVAEADAGGRLHPIMRG
ncbi:MAG: hypothetical protein AB7G47_21520 [Mycolicibacterium sp.]|uniref:hypothetical protein n=1 Tax=Mycolicibacterium sp. TaxID=2320850 RepID=UPI003D131EAD